MPKWTRIQLIATMITILWSPSQRISPKSQNVQNWDENKKGMLEKNCPTCLLWGRVTRRLFGTAESRNFLYKDIHVHRLANRVVSVSATSRKGRKNFAEEYKLKSRNAHSQMSWQKCFWNCANRYIWRTFLAHRKRAQFFVMPTV